MMTDFRKQSSKRANASLPKYDVKILGDDQDLEIIVDNSNIFYGVNIVLIDEEQDSDEDIVVRDDLKKILGQG